MARIRERQRVARTPSWLRHRIDATQAKLSLVPVEPFFPPGACLDWSDVRRVSAYKRDLLTTDLVCLSFEGTSDSLEVNEEMAGWKELVDALPELLPGSLAYGEWFPHVVRPPFAPRFFVVFERAV